MEKRFESRKLLKTLAAIIFIAAVEIMFFRNIIGNDALIGDAGDARYIDLILEHYYKWITGHEKFTDLICFYPTTNTISYSDMLIALAIPFCLFRSLGMSMFMANKLGLILLHLIGTCSMVYLLKRKFKLGYLGVVVGTICFCYANALSVKSWHNQMLTVCLVPLVIILLVNFFENWQKRNAKRIFSALGAITVVALIFYTSFYNAYFLFLYALFFLVCYIIFLCVKKVRCFKATALFVKRNAVEILLYIVFGIAIMIPFFIIYLPTLKSSGGWVWEPILQMLPSWRNFFNVSPYNVLYGPFVDSDYFKTSGIYAGELRTGFPPVEFLLFLTGTGYLFVSYFKNVKKQKAGNVISLKQVVYFMYPVCAVAVICCFILILRFRNYSLWYFVYKYVPGASAIRAVSRFNMFLTLPVAVVIAKSLDDIYLTIKLNAKKKKVVSVLIILCLVLENTLTCGVRSLWTISEAETVTNRVSAPPEDCEVVYILDSSGNYYSDDKNYQLAIWEIAEKYNLKCINGHSGQFPKDWSYKMSPLHGDIEYGQSIDKWIEKYNLKNVYAYDIAENTWSEYKEYPLSYEKGFYKNEENKKGRWIWTGEEEAVISIKNLTDEEKNYRYSFKAQSLKNEGKDFAVYVGNEKVYDGTTDTGETVEVNVDLSSGEKIEIKLIMEDDVSISENDDRKYFGLKILNPDFDIY